MTLRRTTPLARRTELARTPLRRKTAMQRVAKAKRTVERQRKRYDTGPDQATRVALWERANGRCEVCGLPIAMDRWPGYSRHHRLPRGRGGHNRLSNLLLLCGTGTTGCHGLIESQRALAYGNGWLVHTGDEPTEIPVELAKHLEAMYLTDDGDYAPGAP